MSIDDLIAGAGKTNANFDFNSIINQPARQAQEAAFKAEDQSYVREGRNLFKGGVPLDSEGKPDFAAMGKALFQHGDVTQGTALSNTDIQRQQLKLGQEAAARIGALEGGSAATPSPIISPPSTNRSGETPVAPPLNKGGVVPQGQPQANGGASTIMQILTAQGIPNNQIGAASASIARQLGLQDPNAQINIDDPQIRNVLIPAVQQLKRAGIGQPVPQATAQAVPPQPGPPVVPQPVNPQRDQRTFGAPAATPTRGAVPTGNDPEIQKQIATYVSIASNPAYPKEVQAAALARLKALQEQGQPTGPIKEYEFARRQGYEGSFKDFAAEQEAGKAAATERAKVDIKEQQEYIDQGRMAQSRLGTLNTISNVIGSDKNLNLGFGSETTLKLKMALQQAGLDFGDLSGAQLIQKLNGVLASESSKQFSSRPTQFEFKTFLANNPGLALDEKGNVRMLGILSQTAKREVDLGKLARQNRDNWDKWDDVVEKYDSAHPIKDPTTGKVLSSHSIIAPGTPQARATAVPSQAGVDPHPEGSVAFNPQTGQSLKKVNGKWAPIT